MKKSSGKKTTVGAVGSALLLVVIGVALWFFFNGPGKDFGTVTPSELTFGAPYIGAPLNNEYVNTSFDFSLAVPEGVTIGELPVDENGRTVIIIQNEKGEGIQILITPSQGDIREVGEQDIKRQIPDMKIESVEVVEIGDTYRGVAFISSNEAFDGMSREVWFYFRGNLYQISTYARLDTLLKAVFGTWKFF